MEKHVKISHEDVNIFCHFFNNDLECPYNEECIFIHKDSEMCRYGSACERKKCMYKHEDKNDDENDDDENDVDENDDDQNDEEETNGDEDDDEDQADKTFVNPFRSRESVIEDHENENPESEETTNIETENSVEESFKCELCIFETKDSKRFKRHKFEIHSVKGRYVCSGCHEEFINRKHFNSHNYKGCNPSLAAEVRRNKPEQGAE